MYIFAVRVQNFRSIKDGWMFPGPAVNVLAGPNDRGKTSFLLACDLILNPYLQWTRHDILTRFDFFNGDTSQPISVQVWFKSHESESDEVKAKFYDKLTMWRIEKAHDRPVALHPVTTDPLRGIPPEHENLLAVSLRAEWDHNSQTVIAEHAIKDEAGNTLASLSADSKQLLGFRYFSTRRNPLEQLSLSRRSLISRALNDKDLNHALHHLLEVLEHAKSSLVEQPQVQAMLKRLEALAAPELLGYPRGGSGNRFTLTFLNSEIWRLRSATTLAVQLAPTHLVTSEKVEMPPPLPLEYQGDGVQNLLLLLSIAELVTDTGTRSIVAVEEPEQNLEPALAQWVFSKLCSRAELNQNQLFITTHSPALLGEVHGADPLLVTPSHPDPATGSLNILSVRYLPASIRKSFERDREKYAPALLARNVLVVEGPSEIGFLPVAFRHLSTANPSDNPFHLGLQLLNGEDRNQALKYAQVVRAFERPCAILIDHDVPKKSDLTTAGLIQLARESGIPIMCWAGRDLLSFTRGCDLEVVLVHQVAPCVLFEAIMAAYEEPGHEMDPERWIAARNKLDESVRSLLPEALPSNLRGFDLSALPSLEAQQAFVFALLHGPHECKSARDMRLIAEHLAKRDKLPSAFDELRRRIVLAMTNPGMVCDGNPYIIESPLASC